MPIYRSVVIAMLLALDVAIPLQGQIRLRIAEVDPVAPAVLARGQHLSLRVEYQSDAPVRVVARTYNRRHEELPMSSGSPLYPAGIGDAYYWIAFTDVRRVDSVDVTARLANGNIVAHTGIATDLAWSGQPSATPYVYPAWTASLTKEQGKLIVPPQGMQLELQGEKSYLLSAIGIFVALSVPGYFVLQGLLWRRATGQRRRKALAPLWVMIPVLVYTGIAFVAGSNLFPLVLIFTAPIAFVYLAVIALTRD